MLLLFLYYIISYTLIWNVKLIYDKKKYLYTIVNIDKLDKYILQYQIIYYKIIVFTYFTYL